MDNKIRIIKYTKSYVYILICLSLLLNNCGDIEPWYASAENKGIESEVKNGIKFIEYIATDTDKVEFMWGFDTSAANYSYISVPRTRQAAFWVHWVDTVDYDKVKIESKETDYVDIISGTNLDKGDNSVKVQGYIEQQNYVTWLSVSAGNADLVGRDDYWGAGVLNTLGSYVYDVFDRTIYYYQIGPLEHDFTPEDIAFGMNKIIHQAVVDISLVIKTFVTLDLFYDVEPTKNGCLDFNEDPGNRHPEVDSLLKRIPRDSYETQIIQIPGGLIRHNIDGTTQKAAGVSWIDWNYCVVPEIYDTAEHVIREMCHEFMHCKLNGGLEDLDVDKFKYNLLYHNNAYKGHRLEPFQWNWVHFQSY